MKAARDGAGKLVGEGIMVYENKDVFKVNIYLLPITFTYIAGGDIRQKLEFQHVHLELGALGYIETFLFYWSWGFFQKKKPPWPIFVFENTRVPPLDLKKYFF